MSFDLSYMGTKRNLAPAVADIAMSSRRGPFLDLFSGMCSVGSQVGPSREIWCNDAQIFASMVGHSLFRSGAFPGSPGTIASLLSMGFTDHFTKLQSIFGNHEAKEGVALSNATLDSILQQFDEDTDSAPKDTFDNLLKARVARPKEEPFMLFSLLYGNTYFGWRQCMEIDSIVFSIDKSFKEGRLKEDERIWLLLFLGRAMLKVSNTTGHFAQFLRPKQDSLKVYIRQRRRKVWEEFLAAADLCSPIGSVSWRKRNRIFNQDSCDLLPSLIQNRSQPALVYADPPYTTDQYSRYYHVLETLFHYDYPSVSSKARYRQDRFSTPFSKSTTAVEAFTRLVGNISTLQADLILSYPSKGLLHDLGTDPLEIIQKYYKANHIAKYTFEHSHSTMGSSKGNASIVVDEVVYHAKS